MLSSGFFKSYQGRQNLKRNLSRRLGRSAELLLLIFSLGYAGTSCGWGSVGQPVGVTGDGNRVTSRYHGQPLKVFSQPKSTRLGHYRVKKGDTLWGIAKRFGATVSELKNLNGIDSPNNLRIGAFLQIPGVGKAQNKGRLLSNKTYALRWPVQGIVTRGYGKRRGKEHDGIDIAAKKGSPVYAASSGTVVYSKRHGGYGNLVVVKHAKSLVTIYAHNLKNLVKKGDKVRLGQSIALVGDTGAATGSHLHFEVRRGALPQNPLNFLPP